jgi:hypothetical protein
MHITRDRKKRTITLDQCAYADKVLKRFKLQSAKPARTPLPTSYNPTISDIEATSELHSQYQSVIGSLLYIMLGTRPDLAFTVIHMSQFCANVSQEHLSQALYIVRYLGSTKYLTLKFNGANHNGFLGYTDSDWAANPDDRKSITGYVLFLANGPVSWLTRRQKTIALSSTEAEYMVMSDTARQISWIKSLLSEIGFKIPKIPLYCDSQGAVFLATNPAQEMQSKHIGICYHYIRECVEEGDKINLFDIPTDQQLTDIFTKNLSPAKFKAIHKGLHFISSSLS